MTRARFLVPLAVLGAIAPAIAQQPVFPEKAVVRVERDDGVTRVDAIVPGHIVAFTSLGTVDGHRDLMLLVSPRLEAPVTPESELQEDAATEEPPPRKLPPCPTDGEDVDVRLHLYRFSPGDEPQLRLSNDELPRDCDALHATDLDGDGRDELLVGCEDGLRAVDLGPEGDHRADIRHAVEATGTVWRFLRPRSRGAAGHDPALVGGIRLGSLTLYGPQPGGEWSSVGQIDLPLEGEVRAGAVRISSEIPDYLGSVAGVLTFVTEPVAVGPRRLRTLLVETAPSSETHFTECWSSLPESEEVLESDHFVIDGRPVLFVTTRPADKLSLFGEKRIRLFTLERDRSRLGTAPMFAAESRVNLWQDVVPALLDVDGDGRDDLVVGFWKGLVDDKVALDVYLREEDGGFRTAPKTTAFDVKDGDRGVLLYGDDVDGDGLADLLVRNDSDLLLYRGLRSHNGKRLVSDEARVIPGGRGDDESSAEISVPEEWKQLVSGRFAWGRPRLVDLDGDGVSEILVSRRGNVGRPGILRVLRLGDPTP